MELLSTFRFLISLVAALIIALVPPLYDEYKNKKRQTGISFTFEVIEDLGLQILRQRYPHLGTFDTLEERYIESVKTEFTNKKYTVKAVMKQDKIEIPIRTAISLMESIHNPTINLIKCPYLLKLSLQNFSEISIVVDKFIITTDDAYMNPSWALMYAFPCDNKPVLKKSTSNRNGYVLSFDSKMVLPSGTNMDLCVAFPEKPILQTKNSFVQIIDDTKKERSLKLMNS